MKKINSEKRYNCRLHDYKSPNIHKKQGKKRDPEAHSTKKGNTWHFGYKTHIGVDSKMGLVHTVKATSSNVYDVTVVSELSTG